MKKSILLCALMVLLVACDGNRPEEVQSVTFQVTNFSQSTAPMGMPQKAPILDDTEGQALTDIYVFDGSTLLLHQTSDQADFGTFTLSLTHGAHNLSVVATRSTGIAVSGSVMTMENVRSTFGVLHPLTVSSSTPAQELTLQRISGSMTITITDEFPSNADEIEFVIDPRYKQLDVTTLCATSGEARILRDLDYPHRERFITSDGYTFGMPSSSVSKAGQKTKYSVLGLRIRSTIIEIEF